MPEVLAQDTELALPMFTLASTFTLPDAEINPPVNILPPVMLAVTLTTAPR